MPLHSLMSDLANLYSYKGCAATLGITLLFFKIDHFNSQAPTPGLSIALVSALSIVVRGS